MSFVYIILTILLVSILQINSSSYNITGTVYQRFKESTSLIQSIKRNDGVKLSLNGDKYRNEQTLQKDGNFVFANLKPGIYLLEIISPHFYYAPINFEISRKTEGKVRAKIFQGATIVHPVQIYPVYMLTFFEPHRELSIMGLIWQNKMIWFVCALMGMLYFTSKVTSNPEVMQELTKTEIPVVKPNTLLKTLLPTK